MKCLKTIIVICIVPLCFFRVFLNTANCQQYSLKRIAPNLGLNVLAGYSYGMAETWTHHHAESVFSQSRPQSFTGSMSWVRKYKNYPHDTREAFVGSKNVFVWTTDVYHLSRAIERNSVRVSMITYKPPQSNRTIHRILDYILLTLSFQAGFFLEQITLRR